MERFCEANYDALRSFSSAKDSKAALLAAFDAMMERNPAAILEDLTGARAN